MSGDPAQPDRPNSQPGDPFELEYFAAGEPDRRRARRVMLWSFVLLLAWVPYVCGVINISTLAISYSAPVISAHQNGAVLFMGAGIAMSLAGLVGFARLRHTAGLIAAGVVTFMQVTIAVCAGIA
ncbi:MAG: hypothetical protein ACREIT_08185 [Tepidisphaeraceae bacterium]